MVFIEKSWRLLLKDEFEKQYFKDLVSFLKNEYKKYTVFPKYSSIFGMRFLPSIEGYVEYAPKQMDMGYKRHAVYMGLQYVFRGGKISSGVKGNQTLDLQYLCLRPAYSFEKKLPKIFSKEIMKDIENCDNFTYVNSEDAMVQIQLINKKLKRTEKDSNENKNKNKNEIHNAYPIEIEQSSIFEENRKITPIYEKKEFNQKIKNKKKIVFDMDK